MTEALVGGLFVVLGVGLSYWLIHGGTQSSLRRSIREDMDLLAGLHDDSEHRALLEQRIERNLGTYLAEERAQAPDAGTAPDDEAAAPSTPAATTTTWRERWEAVPLVAAFGATYLTTVLVDLPGDVDGSLGQELLAYAVFVLLGAAVYVPLELGGRWVRRRWPWLEM